MVFFLSVSLDDSWRGRLPFRYIGFQTLGSRVVMVWRRSQEETPRQVPFVSTFTPELLELACMTYGTSSMPWLATDIARTDVRGPALTGKVAIY